MANSLTANLDIAPSQRMGASVSVEFTLTNPTDTDYRILRWFTPFDGLTSPSIIVYRNGLPLPYDGLCVLRGDPGPDDYVVVPAGSSVSVTVDLSEAYALDRPGTYEVRLATVLGDHYSSDRVRLAARPRSEHEPLRLITPTNELQLESGTARLTLGAQQRAKEAEQHTQEAAVQPSRLMAITPQQVMSLWSGPSVPKFNGGTLAQQQQVNFAWYIVQAYVLGAYSELVNMGSTRSNHFITWFGDFDGTHVTKLYMGYLYMLMKMAWQFTMDLTGSGCQPGWIAYTYKGATTIWLCAPYWGQPFDGMDSRIATLLHELSHDGALTDDYIYGQSGCQYLASNYPDNAIANAANYTYFAMSTFDR